MRKIQSYFCKYLQHDKTDNKYSHTNECINRLWNKTISRTILTTSGSGEMCLNHVLFRTQLRRNNLWDTDDIACWGLFYRDLAHSPSEHGMEC